MSTTRRLFALSVLACLAAPAAYAQPQASPDRQQRLTSAESFLPMPTLSAGVMNRYSTSGTLVVDMGLDIPNAPLRSRARANQPRLIDALRTALSTYASAYYRDQTAPDPTTMTRLMQTAVDRTLGGTGARVLLANIIYQGRTP